jgi:recombination protein RecR
MNGKYPATLQALILHLKKLPSVGVKTAERFAFDMIRWEERDLAELSTLIAELTSKIISCSTCGCLTQEGVCRFCNSSARDPSTLCILASARDVYAIEETRTFRGLYHVIEHLLSPLDGRTATTLRLDRIEERIRHNNVREVILAFDSTLEGDATALYLKQQLAHLPVSISRLAFGLPVGSNLEAIDATTLAKAFSGRQVVS